ncbi:MAG TPA: hypothetical protein DEP19_06890 [Anaerolineae bacterium]|nr:hypothetical protein [Anaerolineae bacterium]
MFSIFLIYFPLFFLRDIEKISLNQLIQRDSKFKWLNPWYQIILGIVFLPLVIVVIYISVYENQLGRLYFVLLVPFISLITLFHSILASVTGVYAHLGTAYLMRFSYDENKIKIWVANMQMVLAVVVSFASQWIYSL